MRCLVLLTGIWAAVACDDGGGIVALTPPLPPRERPPRVVGFIPDLVVEVDQTVVIEDPQRLIRDASPLKLSVTSSDPAAATATLGDSVLTIVAVSVGMTTVDLVAEEPPGTFAQAVGDTLGRTAHLDFQVTVRPMEDAGRAP